MLEHYVIGTATLLALGGNRQVSGLIRVASGDLLVRLWVPIVSVLGAERQCSGIVGCLGILDTLHTLEADYEAVQVVAGLYRWDVPFGVAAAVHAARPTVERPEGALIATVAPELYDGLGVPVMDLNS